MAYGITSTGFVIKTLDEQKTDLEDGMRAAFGDDINLAPQSNFGQFIGVLSAALSDLWELGQASYSANDPGSATGAQLATLALNVGISKLAATKTTVTVTGSGTNGTAVSAGTKFSTANGVQCEVVTGGTISSGTVSLACQAIDTGPISFLAGTINTIDTPVAGLSSVTNAADHTVLGRNEETDAELRVRRQVALIGTNSQTLDGIRARLANLPGVTDCYVFENVSDSADASGVPAHAIECVVDGGVDADIAQEIFDYKPAGIRTYGSDSDSATDSTAAAHTVYFSRPVELDIYVDLVVGINPATFPSNGVTLIKEAVIDFADANYKLGSEVRAAAMVASILQVPGVLECSMPELSTDGVSYDSATLVLTNRQKAAFDSTRIDVTTSTAPGL